MKHVKTQTSKLNSQEVPLPLLQRGVFPTLHPKTVGPALANVDKTSAGNWETEIHPEE